MSVSNAELPELPASVLTNFLIGLLLFILPPCMVSAWVGTRTQLPIAAFLTSWILTPSLTGIVVLLGTPILREIIPYEGAGTVVLILLLWGSISGLIAGAVAALIVGRRNKKRVISTIVGSPDVETSAIKT